MQQNNMQYQDLAGKIAVVTGAGGGIGRAIVAALREQGARVVATDLDPQALAQAMRESGQDVDCRALDVADPAASRALADAVAQQYGVLDIWVNNAGFMARMPALELDEQTWQRTLDINLKGTFFGAQAAARHMTRQGSGAIINLSSYAGIKPRPNCADYASAKAGVAHLTQCLALEWSPLGVRVNAIAPGFIDTPMSSWMHGDAQTYTEYIARIPSRRLGQPEDIAAATLYLASQASSYVTGHVLMADGGVSKA
ncbi:short-chain dehydrogenase [Bordetella pertussis]|uniref:S-adenosyl-L-homocysteine hydrolase, NAD binding-like domain protein n=5 Tax=Bordetella pertussis TaxID=520 RepID=A0AAI9J755_BORPT|nr:SDR family oxidoreductase [Bordetella pertussis]ETA64323.1 S-adenosyl-L-homocysteine hydrolase, NAD binding-like domain protein [Bordetella pertussis CHLA-11]ETG99437.1 S-adenosyl-L-homocysteine hydrolase, NAD binding-like domain protein [Bordetella pertussis 2250905]ETH04944.1 S-adenosyl-L-homocysteine hydrolase, NAD binding-like domain protein [Bordetella pertussis 2356847]ETH06909.1 S-adenosyl-L-homocysteine hydrolase, NAD binding-like domain protein [Bordetella pertussis 2371640]ETH1268